MISISEEAKQAFKDRNHIRLVLEFDDGTILSNDDIVSNSFSLEQSICEEESLVYGSVNSARFSIKTNKSASTYNGKTVELTMVAGDNSEYSIPLGTFTIENDVKSDDGKFRTLDGYDALYTALSTNVDEWYDHLEFPMTMKQFRDALFEEIGIEQENVTLVNDNMQILKSVQTSGGFLFRTLIQDICEINGALGCMTQGNKFRYIIPDVLSEALIPSDDLYPSDTLYPKYAASIEPIITTGENSTVKQGSFLYKDYYVHPITRIVIRETDDDIGSYYGEGDNEYAIVGNMFTYGMDNATKVEVASRLYPIFNSVMYTPTKITMLANPWFEVGDYIKLVGYDVASVIPILSRRMDGITNAQDTYLANGTEYHAEKSNGVSYSLRQLRGRTARIETNVDRIETEMTAKFEEIDGEIVDMSSRITQNAEQIQLRVEKANVISAINQTAEQITIDASKINLNGVVSANNNVTIDTDGKITAHEAMLDGTITSYDADSGNKTVMQSGQIDFYRDNVNIGRITPSQYDGTNFTGMMFGLPGHGDFIGFGKDNDLEYADENNTLYLNYGADPEGYTEDIIALGTVRFANAVKMSGVFKDFVQIGEYTRTYTAVSRSSQGYALHGTWKTDVYSNNISGSNFFIPVPVSLPKAPDFGFAVITGISAINLMSNEQLKSSGGSLITADLQYTANNMLNYHKGTIGTAVVQDYASGYYPNSTDSMVYFAFCTNTDNGSVADQPLTRTLYAKDAAVDSSSLPSGYTVYPAANAQMSVFMRAGGGLLEISIKYMVFCI